MKPEIKKRWLRALRSGQYAQATGKLTDGHGFCCLGVLCNLYALEHGVQWVRRMDDRLALDGIEAQAERYSQVPPPHVRQWAGLALENPCIKAVQTPNGRADSLAEANDQGMTFREIAGLIAKNL